MCDRKPSQFLRHLRSLAPDMPDYLLRILWTSRLPANIQTTLADMSEVGLEAQILSADRITEAVSPSTIASIRQRPDNTEFLQCIGHLSCQLVNLTAERERNLLNSKERQFNFSDRRSYLRSSSSRRSPSRHHTANTYCLYCLLFCFKVKVKVKVMLRQTVSQSVCRSVKFTLELVTRYYILSERCCVVSVGRPL
jgi:hypothetical protein